MCTLDSFDLKPCFIKIDTEWSELDVVRGALETIRRHRPILMIENSSPHEMNELLEAIDYSPFHFDGGLHPGVGETGNAIYLHQGHLKLLGPLSAQGLFALLLRPARGS